MYFTVVSYPSAAPAAALNQDVGATQRIRTP
jgi:hypothetical protein